MAISLSSISKTKRAMAPPRLVIYGEHGCGKTTLASGAHKPIFIPLEDGLTGLEVDAFPILTSWNQVKEALNALADQQDFATVAIDSLDWLEPLIWDQVCAAHETKVKTIEDIPYGRGYAAAASYWREFLDLCDRLRARGMAVILIAHSEIKRYAAPDSEGYDRFQIKLHRLASAIVQEWADVIGFAQFETQIKKQDAGFGKVNARGVSTGRRLLHVVETPAYVAKNRYGMPNTIPLSWNDLVSAIQTQPTQA